ncbi:MAG: hypothetical protein ABI664_15375 [bacterium]
MTSLVRRFLKTAILFLIAGLAIGGWMLVELAHARSDALWLRWVVLIAGSLQVAGLVAFFATMWSRIRAVGSVAREESGERF